MHIPAAPTIRAHSPPDYSTRFARWLRVASVVLTVVRVARNWNNPR